MKLSKKQKLEAYTYCLLTYLFEIEQGICTAVCPNLRTWYQLETGNERLSCLDVLQFFPEFSSTKPRIKSEDDFWWPETSRKRQSAIERAIQLTEKLKA